MSEVASSFPPFGFRLDRVGRFPGVVYLAPEPGEPFVEMTRTFSRYWPEHPPYEGAYPDTIPHLTVVDGDEPEGVADALSELVPIPARATELWLMVEGEHGWGLHGRYPLGGTERD